MSNQPNNPYTQAADAYGKSSTAAPTDQRALEGQVLMKAARQLQVLRDQIKSGNKPTLEDIEHAITYNRKLWTVFVDAAVEGSTELPIDLRSNIANIGTFIFKRSIELLADPAPEKFDAIIDINRQIASGLLKQQPQAEDTQTHE